MADGETADTAHAGIRLDSLTSLRFFAALLVVLLHGILITADSGGPLEAVGLAGFVGVEFFFVLSGFVLTWSYDVGLARRHFYGRRFARIYPLHLLTALLAVSIAGWIAVRSGRLETVANVLLLHAWPPFEQFPNSLNPVSWTLSCEAFFYALFPFVVGPLGRVRHRLAWGVVIWAAMLVMFVLLVAGHLDILVYPGTYHGPWFRVGSFLVGILLAHAVRDGYRPRIALWSAVVAFLAVYGVGTALAVEFRDSPWRLAATDLLVLPACVLTIAAAASADLGGRAGLRQCWLVGLGRASFALYVSHYLLLRVGERLGWHGAGWTGTLMIVPAGMVCVALSVVLFRYVERPMERVLRRRFGSPGVWPSMGLHGSTHHVRPGGRAPRSGRRPS